MRPSKIRQLIGDLGRLYRFLSDPNASLPHFPDARRKSNARILVDLIAWRLRNGQIKYYFFWGLYRRGALASSSFLNPREFDRLRDANNRKPVGATQVDYTLLLADKYLFSLYVDAMGYPTPRVLALVEPDHITWLHPRRSVPLESVLDPDRPIDAFCKEVLGMEGKGAFRLGAADGTIWINEKASNLAELSARLTARSILQERVVQHPALNALYPHSVNTLRVVTVRHGEEVQLFSYPIFRTGVRGNVVDNWSDGGILVLVDPSSGILRGPGRFIHQGVVTHHPDTGVPFDGFEIPFYRPAVDLALRLHHDFPALHSVGWDLAITPAGPVVLEGNSKWEGRLRMGLDPNFKREFLRLFAPA
jgi:hypothetical protein